jgi:hypothetical protein
MFNQSKVSSWESKHLTTRVHQALYYYLKRPKPYLQYLFTAQSEIAEFSTIFSSVCPYTLYLVCSINLKWALKRANNNTSSGCRQACEGMERANGIQKNSPMFSISSNNVLPSAWLAETILLFLGSTKGFMKPWSYRYIVHVPVPVRQGKSLSTVIWIFLNGQSLKLLKRLRHYSREVRKDLKKHSRVFRVARNEATVPYLTVTRYGRGVGSIGLWTSSRWFVR